MFLIFLVLMFVFSCSFIFSCCALQIIDRVFGGECNTKQVYEEAAREVALSVVSGINCKYYHHSFYFPVAISFKMRIFD